MSVAQHLAETMPAPVKRAVSESGWLDEHFMFAGTTELAIALSRRGLLDEGGFTPLGRAVRDIIGRGKASLADRRDSNRLPKAGDDPSSAPCEASQSGGSEASASPNPSTHTTDGGGG